MTRYFTGDVATPPLFCEADEWANHSLATADVADLVEPGLDSDAVGRGERPRRTLPLDFDIAAQRRILRERARDRRRHARATRHQSPRRRRARRSRRHRSPQHDPTMAGTSTPHRRPYRMWRTNHPRHLRRYRTVAQLSAGPLRHRRSDAPMDLAATPLARFFRGPVQGIGLLAYFVTLPIVIVSQWRTSHLLVHPLLERLLLVALALLWLAFAVTVLRAVRRGEPEATTGATWLAGVLLSVLPMLSPHLTTPASSTPPTMNAQGPLRAATVTPLGILLATKRQRDAARDGALVAPADNVDLEALHGVHHYLGGARAGVAKIPDDFAHLERLYEDDPVVVYKVDGQPGSTTVCYARPGATLSVPTQWSPSQLRDELVAIPDVRIAFADDERALLRALATRQRSMTVVYTGDPTTIDDELRSLCVCVERGAPSTTASERVSVALLRSVPHVLGLREPFVPALRRRCVEMVAYLSLQDDPTSGDRLRTRVLVNVDVDASKATLANTASSVRRSLGDDHLGPRLHPVSAAGLYELHGVENDVRQFLTFIATARRGDDTAAFTALRQALLLVHGEPLASVSKGYEWFFLDGHLAGVQRAGEWAARHLARLAEERDDPDTAFWALRQGLLLDPSNDDLRAALYAVPRLREFGRYRTDTPEN